MIRTKLAIAMACATALLAVRAAGVGAGAAPAERRPQQARPAAAHEELGARLQAALDEWVAAGRAPGGTAGVVLGDGTAIGLAAGVSDRASRRPMRPDDRMLAGSVGKTYAAAVALQLVHEGAIGLDDPVEKWLGREAWFPRLPNARSLTIRALMTHTSGLVRYEFKEAFTDDLTANPMKTWRPEEQLAYLFDTPASFPVGEGWEYSDTNYIVLGMIIERATGARYYAELGRRLLVPLGLADTIPQDGPELAGVVQGYAGANNPFGGSDEMIRDGRFVINPQFEWTGGGVAATALDLARWAKALFEGRAFDRSLLPTMVDGVPARLGPESRYGLGVIIRPTTPLGRSWGHSGFFPGYQTDVQYFPDAGVAVAVQINTSVPRATAPPLGRFVVELAALAAGG